jgi:IS5 family transposase
MILEPMYVNKTASKDWPEADGIVMFKMLVLKQWHCLSDPNLRSSVLIASLSGVFLAFLIISRQHYCLVIHKENYR